MSVLKLLSIKNVGRLTALAAAGDVTFKRLTLIYGDNASGKTTISGILGSLTTGDPAAIKERATLGAAPPEIAILLSGGTLTFGGANWSGSRPSVEVFDDTFIRDNVYAGDAVDKEQRKNLYQVVVGPTAVALARRIDDLDSEGRASSRKIGDLEAQLQSHIHAPFPIAEFLALPPITDATDRIAALTKELSAARNAKDVVNRPSLSPLLAPESPRSAVQVLDTTLATLTTEAQDRVRQHIAKYFDDRGEAWLRQGLTYVRDNSCPFCEQSLEGLSLIEMFRQYFSNAYEAHVVAIQRSLNELEQTLGPARLAAFQKTALENAGRIGAWRDFVDLENAAFKSEQFDAASTRLRTVLSSSLRSKLANPASIVHDQAELEAAFQDYEAIALEVKRTNDEIRSANDAISKVKTSAASAKEGDLEQELRRLRNTQIRQEPLVSSLCDQLLME